MLSVATARQMLKLGEQLLMLGVPLLLFINGCCATSLLLLVVVVVVLLLLLLLLSLLLLCTSRSSLSLRWSMIPLGV
jgi:predicted metal-binding membrane protein